MDVSLESPGSILRRMTIVVPADKLDQSIEKRIVGLTKTAKIPGFRPGKVPKKVIQSRFSSQVLHEAVEELIDLSYREALQDRSIIPVGFPSIETRKMVPGEDLEYIATFEVFPEVENSHIKDIEIEKPVCVVEGGDIDRTIETLLRQHTEWEAEESSSELGDRLIIDFVGTIEGETFEGSESKDYSLILGRNGLLPELEKGLQEQLPNNEVLISTQFPQDYHVEDLAGKVAEFKVMIKEVAKPRVPVLNDDFIRKFGLTDETEEAFRRKIRENLEQEMENRVNSIVRQSVFNALLHANKFEVPKALVEDEINRGIAAFNRHMEQQGLPVDESVDREKYRPEAERRVRLALVMREAVISHDIQSDDSVVRSRVEKLAQGYDDPKQVIDWHYADANRLKQFEGIVVEELLVEQLLLEANVIEKKITLQELMNEDAPSVTDATRK